MSARTPLNLAITLLLLPLIYVASYCCLVVPGGTCHRNPNRISSYRVNLVFLDYLFLPLESVDRVVRHSTWEPEYDQRPPIAGLLH